VGLFVFEERGDPPHQVAVIKDKTWLESLCRSYTEANVRTLGGWANGEDTDPDLRLRAINALMDRGWGKAIQPSENKHEIKGEVRVILRKMLTDEELDEK
jgi:hypothetical protein